jgi:hypothetical protein
MKVLLLLLALALPTAGAELRAGAAKACVTPALGTLVNGDIGPGIARYIHDDLFARALVLDDGPSRLAFVVVDTCLLDRGVCDEAKRLHPAAGAVPVWGLRNLAHENQRARNQCHSENDRLLA